MRQTHWISNRFVFCGSWSDVFTSRFQRISVVDDSISFVTCVLTLYGIAISSFILGESPLLLDRKTRERHSISHSHRRSDRWNTWSNLTNPFIFRSLSSDSKDCHNHIGYVTYWLANRSELLFFLQQDRQMQKFSDDFRRRLLERLQRLFYHLIDLLQNELDKYLPALINDSFSDETISIEENLFESHWHWLKISRTQSHLMTMKNLFSILSSLMTLLRKCRVNAALTIQIFSHLFLSINTWLFNRIVCSTELNLRSYESAVRMTSHLLTLRQWTEKQGLELIFDYHLTKVNQLLTFLTSVRRSSEDGFPVGPAEDPNVRLPFVFPDDGYTCEYLQGIPHGLLEFIEKYIRVIPCRVFLHPSSLGYWTEFFTQPHSIETIRLTKRGNGLGLSIVAAKVCSGRQRWSQMCDHLSVISEWIAIVPRCLCSRGRGKWRGKTGRTPRTRRSTVSSR